MAIPQCEHVDVAPAAESPVCHEFPSLRKLESFYAV